MNFRPLLKFLSFALVAGFSTTAFAQNTPLLVNNGAMFYINGNVGDSAIVYVDGTVENNDSLMVNLGKFIIKGDFINNAESGGTNAFPTFIEANDGLFEVHGDWENNGIYRAGEGKVRFPTDGTILGDSVTTFHDLELVGAITRGIYVDPLNTDTTTIDVIIDETGTLNLDSGEFATNANMLWVLNPSTGAIIREDCGTCGFVSSLYNGSLARVVNQNSNYLFPTGSSIDAPTDPNNFKRYRPVLLTPSTSDQDTLTVRFVNRTPNVDSLDVSLVDDSICFVNPWWYHRINQLGNVVPTTGIAINSNTFEGDEIYNEMANWSAANSRWEGMPNTSHGIVNFLPQVVAADHDDYQVLPEDAYILAVSVPDAPNVEGDTALCASVPQTYSVPENGSEYDFVVTGGTVIDEDDYSVTVVWENDSLGAVFGTVEVIETVPNGVNGGCASWIRTQPIEIWPLPVANFTVGTDTTLPGGIFVYDILAMQDSSLLTSEWAWDFGDGTTSTDSMPFHTYHDVGDYTIQLIVTSGLECMDTLEVDVSVVEGLIVPNVFTPNNDGWNDVFDVRTSNVGPFKIEIYNRWGNVVFETTSPQISWDGSTAAGTAAAAGTYFYVISRADLNSGNAINNELDNFNYQETGWVQLIR
jgi:gliding motility-associated-like protein